jgi:hypothetical protein
MTVLARANSNLPVNESSLDRVVRLLSVSNKVNTEEENIQRWLLPPSNAQ